MKSTELRNLIREEIKNALSEAGADMSFLDKVGQGIRKDIGVEKVTENEPKVSTALAQKGERLEDMQAYKQLMRALQSKSSADQANFVYKMLTRFDLDNSAKTKLRRYVNSQNFMKSGAEG